MNEEDIKRNHPELHRAYLRIVDALRLVEDGAEISERLPQALKPKMAAQIEALDLAGKRLLDRVDKDTGKAHPDDIELVRERSKQLLKAARNTHREAEFLDDGPAVTSIDALADAASAAADRVKRPHRPS